MMNAPIIITVPNGYLAEKVGGDSDSPMPSRKRRLDHLSWEEKMQRKKLKNRVAAQTSRDRKKAKMDDMESRIKQLEDRNEQLVKEMESLRALNERLVSENMSLRCSKTVARDVVGEASGPAESYPQQKEPSPTAIRAARLLVTLCLLSQTFSHTSTQTNTSTRCKLLQTPCSEKLMQTLQARLQMPRSKLANMMKELKWWGPQQSNWNPIEVQS